MAVRCETTHNTGCQSCLGFAVKSHTSSPRDFYFSDNNPNTDDDEAIAVAATESGYITLRPRGESVARQVNYSGDEM